MKALDRKLLRDLRAMWSQALTPRVHRPVAGDGLLLTDRLADKLGLRVGDGVRLQLTEGVRREFSLPVDGLVRETMLLNACARREVLNRAMGDGDLSSGLVMSLERGSEVAFLAATQQLPRTCAMAALAVLVAALGSAAVVRRRIHRIDMVSALKTRE